jgi:hypothetical protein
VDIVDGCLLVADVEHGRQERCLRRGSLGVEARGQLLLVVDEAFEGVVVVHPGALETGQELASFGVLGEQLP